MKQNNKPIFLTCVKPQDLLWIFINYFKTKRAEIFSISPKKNYICNSKSKSDI